jgi:hypothetical protein
MTVDDWVLEAVQLAGDNGATVRDVQRRIDERHYEELAIDTIEASLATLLRSERVAEQDGRWTFVRKTTKEDALKRLFGDA